jgi:hypothetical protein
MSDAMLWLLHEVRTLNTWTYPPDLYPGHLTSSCVNNAILSLTVLEHLAISMNP